LRTATRELWGAFWHSCGEKKRLILNEKEEVENPAVFLERGGKGREKSIPRVDGGKKR